MTTQTTFPFIPCSSGAQSPENFPCSSGAQSPENFPCSSGALPPENPPPLPPEFFELRNLLQNAYGPDNAVTIEQMCRYLRLNRRNVECLIEISLAHMPFTLVASSRGYYVPLDPADVDHYVNSLQSRIKSIATRMRTVKRQARRYGPREEP